ncbi:MAG: hypothetical protein ACLTDX_00010 [[Clostridium] innocuum]
MAPRRRTRGNSHKLMAALHTSVKEISIHDACEQHFHDIGHDPKQLDITYENTQARERDADSDGFSQYIQRHCLG